MIKSFIRGELRFWECSKCGNWHDGESYKCPLEAQKKEIRKWLMDKIEEETGYGDLNIMDISRFDDKFLKGGGRVSDI